MERWAISLDGEARRRLKADDIEVGTVMAGPDGRRILVFRDRFAGLRVASAAGANLVPYRESGSRGAN